MLGWRSTWIPWAIVSSSTAPPAYGLRYHSTRTTESFRCPPSAWPAGQSERLAITLAFVWGSGRPASMADSRQLRPDALNSVADPAAGLRPEAPRAIVASSTAPSACGLRWGCTRTTESFRCQPSAWPTGQSERLTIRLRSAWAPGRPDSAAGARRLYPADP